jgi:hypothetical protein
MPKRADSESHLGIPTHNSNFGQNSQPSNTTGRLALSLLPQNQHRLNFVHQRHRPRNAIAVTGEVKHHVFTQELDGGYSTTFCPSCGTTILLTPMERGHLKGAVLVQAGTLSEEDFASQGRRMRRVLPSTVRRL